MTGLIDPVAIAEIVVPGGAYCLWDERNRRTVTCRGCGSVLEAGQGVIFRKRRYAMRIAGYYCNTCIGNELRSIPEWWFQPLLEYLCVAHPWATYRFRLPGAVLAQAWLDGKLYEKVMELTKSGGGS